MKFQLVSTLSAHVSHSYLSYSMLPGFILRIIIKIKSEYIWKSCEVLTHRKYSERKYFGIKKPVFGGNRNSDFYSATITDWVWIFIKLKLI